MYLEKAGHKCAKRTIKRCIILMDLKTDENGGKREDRGWLEWVEDSERMEDEEMMMAGYESRLLRSQIVNLTYKK